ncbi:DegT/DnrJ/EryC1/StrS family aminotransferase [Candidatus Saccharibacteria bacterium]|nr:DegT/DnrJ/EryC1/StrS family aminotransferase [Candidatus Saccharibacteria bacterium]
MSFLRKHYFLGQAADYSGEDILRHLFTIGRTRDLDVLKRYLIQRYQGNQAMLCKNGRSALCLALKTYFEPGDMVIVNGFTCYAVYEAVIAAGLKPLFADITRDDLNFNIDTLARGMKSVDSHALKVRGIIIQNSLGNPVDVKAVEKFAKEHGLMIIEDLAHCTGVKYADGRECGTVGVAAAFSFGKDKTIDTISGGAVVLREGLSPSFETRPAGPSPRAAGANSRLARLRNLSAPVKAPRLSDHLRAKFYPLFGSICRGLSYVHLGGFLMRGLVKIHWVEKSADNRLDLKRRISKFEAKLALEQFKHLKRSGEAPIREFAFVEDRDEVLKELAKAGYYFDGLWYKQPVSPERYYKKVHFPEKECPNSVFVAEHIVNFPTYYARSDLKVAREIVKKHAVKEGNE